MCDMSDLNLGSMYYESSALTTGLMARMSWKIIYHKKYFFSQCGVSGVWWNFMFSTPPVFHTQ